MFFFFAVWAGAQTAPKHQQKKHVPAQTAKKSHRPCRALFFFGCLGGWVCSCFCCLDGGVFVFAVWAGGVFFFLLFGRGRVLFLLFGRGRVIFCAVWAGGVFFFCCLGWGCFFFLLFGRGTGVHSLTRLPGSSLSDPTTKETEQQKKTRAPYGSI